MTRYLAPVFSALIAGCVAPEAGRSTAAHGVAGGPVFVAAAPAWPAPQEPLDRTPITAAETVGAAVDE